MKWLSSLRTHYILNRHPIPHTLWQSVLHETTIFHHLSAVERAHLRELTTLFLYRKRINSVKTLPLSERMRVIIAAQACLLILHLGLRYFDDWVEVIVYPGAFRIERDTTDENGLVSHQSNVLSGESWSHGPVILSWEDIEQDLAHPLGGRNVIIHEFAHKLDMLNGRANGMPPLHASMEISVWTNTFSAAYEHFQTQLALFHSTPIDPYAAMSPAEFFAVVSEYFFSAPRTLHQIYPDVFAQLALFYRQNPLNRHSA